MDSQLTILLIGTVDTKSDEVAFMREVIEQAGGRALVMDVGVLGQGDCAVDIPNTEVARAANTTLQQVMDSGDENSAMVLMANGAALLAAQLQVQGRIHGLLALGGSMGTDLALDVANVLPLGFPKVVVSTIAHSPLLPPDRLAPDLMMVLWAGGLYGLNGLCRSALSQAAGAVLGAARSARQPRFDRPLVGMTSLGSSALTYMKRLKPALAQRGYDLAVFHSTGMGGRAFEALAAQGRFVAVMDFCLQELVNQIGGSCVSAGPDRLRVAGRHGVPQIVAPGATDMLDFPAWSAAPACAEGRPRHDHNRLIASVGIDARMRRQVAREIGQRLSEAKGPACLLLPQQGVEGWDRPGQPLHDPDGLAAFVDEAQRAAPPNAELVVLDAHINDPQFVDAALQVFDRWVAEGRMATTGNGMGSSAT